MSSLSHVPPHPGWVELRLGGSTTLNLENGHNLHYCGETSKLLATARFDGKRFRCINSANQAYSTAHSLIRFQFDLLAFEPDMIRVMHNVNDLNVNLFSQDEKHNYARKYLDERYASTEFARDRILRRFRVGVALDRQWQTFRRWVDSQREVNVDGQLIRSTMRFNPNPTELRPLNRHAFKRASSSGCSLTRRSTIGSSTRTEEWPQLSESYNAIIEGVAREHGVPFIDMYGLFGHEPEHFTDAFHYSATGIMRFAEILAPELRKLESVDRAAEPSP